MFRYCPYYRAQKWKMRRNRIFYADIAAVLNYSPNYINKIMHNPETPAHVCLVNRAIDQIIQQRHNGQYSPTPSMLETNTDMREKLRELNISHAELAAAMGLKPGTLTMRLARPLSDTTRRAIARGIQTIMDARESGEKEQKV